MSGRISFSSSRTSLYLCAFILAVSLFSGLLFAPTTLDDRAYVQLRHAQTWLNGAGWQSDPAVDDVVPPWPSPLYVLLLVGIKGLGFDLETGAIVLSALGFAVLSILLHMVAQKMRLPFTAWALPVVLALKPAVFFELLLAQFKAPWPGFDWVRLSFPLVGLLSFVILLLFGWVIDWLIERQVVQIEIETEVSRLQLVRQMGVLLILPILILQGWLLFQQREGTNLFLQTEAKAAEWLLENSAEDAVVFGSPRLAFLANRPRLHANAVNAVEDLPRFMHGVMVNAPDYFVTDGSLAWGYVVRTGWFADHYTLAENVPLTADSRSTLIIWQKKGAVPATQQLSAPKMLTQEGLNFVDGALSVNQIQPGEALNVRIDWQVERPPTATLQTIVRLESPLDQSVWAQRDMRMPRSVPADWLVAGMVFPETFVLTTTADIPVGGYRVSASIYQPRGDGLSAMTRPGEEGQFDRVTIGYVSVPWPGQVPDSAQLVEAVFGNQIKLLSCDCPAEGVPGAQVPINLYWTAANPIGDNYVAFVHLLDGAGQYVTGLDSPPYGGRYDMRAWLSGDTIPDERLLTLPADLPPGEYSLRVGLYHPADGNRLPAVDRDGVVAPDQTIVLPSIQIVSE